MKPKVIIITGGFTPAVKYGGPVVSIENIINLLHEYFEFFIITTDTEMGEESRLEGISEGWNNDGKKNILYLPKKSLNYINLKNIIKGIRPDTIYINSLFNARFTMPILFISNLLKINLVIAPRGELCINALKTRMIKKRIYIYLLNFLLKDNIVFQATSDEELIQINKLLSIPKNQIKLITNIPSIPKKDNESPIKVSGELNCVFLSRIHPKKQLLEAVEMVKCSSSIINLDIYGPIEDIRYWEKVQKKITSCEKNITVSYKGIVENNKVNKILANYDLFILPTLSENYGHVIVEALLAKCPVLISDQTPWSDINDFNCGNSFSLNELSKFCNRIDEFALMNNEQYCIIRNNCRKYTDFKLNLKNLKEDYKWLFNLTGYNQRNFENNNL